MNYSDAMLTNEKQYWIEGVKKEFNNLVELNSFVETTLPKNRKAIATRWVMHRKTDGRYRPRLVVKGFQQIKGVDYFNSYAPVAGYNIFRLVLSISANLDLNIETYDSSTAFAQNNLEEEVYIDIPEGFDDYCKNLKKENVNIGDKRVLLLKKTLNGLIQGAYNQYKNVEQQLKK